MTFILKTERISRKKEISKIIKTIFIFFLLILIMLFIKFKLAYRVIIDGKTIGYIDSINKFDKLIEDTIIDNKEENIAYITLENEPEYKINFIPRAETIDDEKVLDEIKSKYSTIMYKYYEVALNNETKAYVDELEEAYEIVDEMKSKYYYDSELDFQINEKYTEDIENIGTDTLEKATDIIEVAASKIEEKNNAIAVINEVNFSYLPVNGRITSRYGESSSLRRSTHTGLDIACDWGTPIKSVSTGIVTFAGKSGSYGNLVKIMHENGVETWYGHCSNIFVTEGQNILAGDEIAAVGSTGNSTGPHLHFEIRINGEPINPQDYMY